MEVSAFVSAIPFDEGRNRLEFRIGCCLAIRKQKTRIAEPETCFVQLYLRIEETVLTCAMSIISLQEI
jgi:hypothetical protein